MNGDFNLEKSVGNPGGEFKLWYCASVRCFSSFEATFWKGYSAVGYWMTEDGKDVVIVDEADGKAMLGKCGIYGAAIALNETLVKLDRMSGLLTVCMLGRGLGIGFLIDDVDVGIPLVCKVLP